MPSVLLVVLSYSRSLKQKNAISIKTTSANQMAILAENTLL